MSEKSLMIPVARGIELESRYEPGLRPQVAMVCHPHPLYGGSMDNNVVMALRKAFRAHERGTLRFNFRGVGRSGGAYADGEGEAEDLKVLVTRLQEIDQTVRSICVAGYSFGAWVALKAIHKGLEAKTLVLVSPPVDLLDFNHLMLPECPCLITCGDEDDFCAQRSLLDWLATHSPKKEAYDVEIIANTDHFYWGREKALEQRVKTFLAEHG